MTSAIRSEGGDDPDCLHCALGRLASEWIDNERVTPDQAVLRGAEALGCLIGRFPVPAERAAVLKAATVLIRRVALQVVQDRLRYRHAQGHA